MYFVGNFQIGHVAVKYGRLKHERACAHPDRSCDSLNQLPKKHVTCVAASLARAPKGRRLE